VFYGSLSELSCMGLNVIKFLSSDWAIKSLVRFLETQSRLLGFGCSRSFRASIPLSNIRSFPLSEVYHLNLISHHLALLEFHPGTCPTKHKTKCSSLRLHCHCLNQSPSSHTQSNVNSPKSNQKTK
jgi:hypothetical protein